MLTGCCLVTRTVKVISTDLEHRPLYLRINIIQFVSFFVHNRKSRDRFRIRVKLQSNFVNESVDSTNSSLAQSKFKVPTSVYYTFNEIPSVYCKVYKREVFVNSRWDSGLNAEDISSNDEAVMSPKKPTTVLQASFITSIFWDSLNC